MYRELGPPAWPDRLSHGEPAAWGVWNTSADLLPAVYVRSVEAAGGAAVLLPPQRIGADDIVARIWTD